MFDECNKKSVYCVNIKNRMNRIMNHKRITNRMSQIRILHTLQFPLNHFIIYVINIVKK